MDIPRRSTEHRKLRLLALMVATALLSGCALIASPPGGAPLRYRDEIFSGVDTSTDLLYPFAPGLNNETQDLRLDLYAPHGDTATARPAVVLVHSGAFSFGNKDSAELVDLAGVANQTRYRIDPDRIAMAGSSAGGITVIPFGWSLETAVASLSAGVYVNLQPFGDADHVPFTQFRDQIVAHTIDFVYQQLHLDAAAT